MWHMEQRIKILSIVLEHEIFNKYHSVYRADKTPHWLLTFLEKIMPGKSGNNIVVFKKKTK